jgi:hypothetical protein
MEDIRGALPRRAQNGGALPAGHAPFAVRDEGEQRHRREPVNGVEGVVADVARGHSATAIPARPAITVSRSSWA